jgi:hypothetical protein
MVNNDNLSGSKELLGDNDRAESICSSTASIADYVGGTKLDTENLSWVEPSIHTSNYSDVTTTY